MILGLLAVGKSTLLKFLGGLDSVTSDEIIVKGEHVKHSMTIIFQTTGQKMSDSFSNSAI